MSQFYGTADRAESVRTIHAAIDVDIDFFDTPDGYGAVAAVIPWNSSFSAATAKLVPALLAGSTVVDSKCRRRTPSA
jgi:acyl-CoA reductase-like NAD-dependent aldehyde dehydrogenase